MPPSFLPYAADGMRIGLLGGSFDPPHAGHVHISKLALTRLGLHRVWWLVSPGNPLKSRAPAPLQVRMDACRSLIKHPKILPTDLEANLGTRYTADTLAHLQRRYGGVTFVWLMGADNLAGFHNWEKWDGIMRSLPIAVLARPGEQISAGLSPAARRFARYRLPARRAAALATRPAPCWSLLTGPMLDISSTRLRNSGHWPQG